MAKLQAVEQEVRLVNPTIETRIVQADFYANSNIKFYENLMDQVKDIDIGLAVLNAGVMNVGRFES